MFAEVQYMYVYTVQCTYICTLYSTLYSSVNCRGFCSDSTVYMARSADHAKSALSPSKMLTDFSLNATFTLYAIIIRESTQYQDNSFVILILSGRRVTKVTLIFKMSYTATTPITFEFAWFRTMHLCYRLQKKNSNIP